MLNMLEELESLVNEASFTQADIPKNFIMVFDLEYDVEMKELLNRKLKGVRGISGNNNIITDFFGVARDAMLLMDGKETVKLNNLSRVQYDNPNYLVSNGLDPLFRIWAKSKRKNGYEAVIQNFLGHLKAVAKREGMDDVEYSLSYSSAFDFCIGGHFFKSKPNIENFNQFFKWMRKTIQNMPRDCKKWVKGVEHHVRLVNDLSDSVFRMLLLKTLKEIGRTYKSEGEWFLKDTVLNIPKNTKLVIGVASNPELVKGLLQGKLEQAIEKISPAALFFMDDQIEKMRKVKEKVDKLKKKYKVELLDMKEYEQLRDEVWKEEDFGARAAKLGARFN